MIDLSRRSLLGAAAVTAAAAGAVQAQTAGAGAIAPPDPTEVVRLWPNGAPGGEAVTVTPIVPERSTDPAFHDRYAQYTTDPILTVLRPERPNGAALLLIPGGGYRWAVLDKEGFDVARVFAAAGVTCFVLRYRLPADGWAAGPNAPLPASPAWAPRPGAIWPVCWRPGPTRPTRPWTRLTRPRTGPT